MEQISNLIMITLGNLNVNKTSLPNVQMTSSQTTKRHGKVVDIFKIPKNTGHFTNFTELWAATFLLIFHYIVVTSKYIQSCSLFHIE